MTNIRVGSGFDAHRLVGGGPLRLGGVAIDWDQHLDGHSDGDCLLHAVGDALLGAAAQGDMGAHFPSSDPRWRGAASLTFLEAIAAVVARAGYRIGNIDALVIAQPPPLIAHHLGAMRTAIAAALGISTQDVSVKAKSTDRLGTIGRSEGIAAQAVVLVVKD